MVNKYLPQAGTIVPKVGRGTPSRQMSCRCSSAAPSFAADERPQRHKPDAVFPEHIRVHAEFPGPGETAGTREKGLGCAVLSCICRFPGKTVFCQCVDGIGCRKRSTK